MTVLEAADTFGGGTRTSELTARLTALGGIIETGVRFAAAQSALRFLNLDD